MLTNSNELLGRTLGTCTLKRLIGRGGMGAVYLAQQSRPRRTVAVKVLLPHLIEARTRGEFLTRFRREADAIAALDHINIMPIYEYGEQEEIAYLVMPYVTGGTLRERLEVQAIPPIGDVVSIIEQVAAGLACAHALGIIHRDLKPGNILFHADGRVLITDFGLAKMLKDVTEQDSGARVLTSAGSIVGTPEYLSPEQGTGNPTDYHTDIYSAGVVLYQMLAGRVPFTGTTAVSVAIKHALQEPPLITQFNAAIPHSVQAVAMKALAKAPEQRFASAGELARALRLAISDESITAIWRESGTNIPAVTANSPSGSQQITEQAQDQTEPKNLLQVEDNATVALVEDTSAVDQKEESKASLEVNSVKQLSQEEAVRENFSNLPTLEMGLDGDALYVLPTRGTPQGMQHDVQQASSTIVTPGEATEEGKLQPEAFHVAGLSRLSENAQSIQNPQRPSVQASGGYQRMIQQPVVSRVPVGASRSTPTHFEPAWMKIVASLLALLIISGVFAAYMHLRSTPPALSTPTSQVTATSISQVGSTPSPQEQNSTPLPKQGGPTAISPAITVGSQLYGTSNPFAGCDKQGGHWTNASDAHVTCSADGSHIVNPSGHHVTANLSQMAGNQSAWPSQSFVAQVQVTIKPNSQGAFGIDFQPQMDGNPQEYFAYMLSPSGNWSFNHYDAQGNLLDTLVSGKLLSAVSTELTIDIRAEGTDYAFYVNGTDTTGRASIGSQYINKIAGLAVDANADVTFSNFAIYAPS